MELEGKPLAFWLQELLAEESQRRSTAAGLLTRYDDAFKTAVYKALSAPEFPREAWLYALVDFLFWTKDSRMAADRKERERRDRVWEKLQQRYPTPQALREAPNRLNRWMYAHTDPRNRNLQGQGILLIQYVGACAVLSATGRHILAVPACLRRMLANKHYQNIATDLLTELGPDALEEFGDEVMADPDFAPSTLAALIGKSPEHIREIAARLKPPVSTQRRWHTLRVLIPLGPAVNQAAPDCIPDLVALLDVPECQVYAIQALATITQGQERMVDRFLELSYSSDVWIKKAALEALGVIATCPERVVPRLIAAFEDYKEYDPDDTYYSEHSIVVLALERFGARAAAAVPALIARIVQEDCNYLDKGVINCLIAIGPAALPALPELEKFADEDEVAMVEAENGEEEAGYCPAAIGVYRLRQYQPTNPTPTPDDRYVYLGTDTDWPETDRCQVTSREVLNRWLQKTFGLRLPVQITLTYIVLSPGELWVAERHSEHASCARGLPVLAAGELTLDLEEFAVVEISNLSTGYCPAPECWPAVESALDAVGLVRPTAFTQSFIFRSCSNCHQRQVIHDDDFTCCFCDSPL